MKGASPRTSLHGMPVSFKAKCQNTSKARSFFIIYSHARNCEKGCPDRVPQCYTRSRRVDQGLPHQELLSLGSPGLIAPLGIWEVQLSPSPHRVN